MAPKTTKTRTSKDTGDDWDEIPSTATIRWWHPGEDEESSLVCEVKERCERGTKYGDRAYYLVRALAPAFDESDKGPIEPGTSLIIWESAGLRDLNQWVGGKTVKIVPSGTVGRTRVYRFLVPKGGK